MPKCKYEGQDRQREGSVFKRNSQTASEISRETLEAHIKTVLKKKKKNPAGPLAKTSEWFLNAHTEPPIINSGVE